MKRLLIILSLLIAISVTGQVTPKTPFNIPDNNTAFGINLPEGSYIYDVATDSVWILNAVGTTTTTLRTATKTLISPVNSSTVDHGSLIGLTDDDHSQYPLLEGRIGNKLKIDSIASINNSGNLYLAPNLYLKNDENTEEGEALITLPDFSQAISFSTNVGMAFYSGEYYLLFNKDNEIYTPFATTLGTSAFPFGKFYSTNISDDNINIKVNVPVGNYDSLLITNGTTVYKKASDYLKTELDGVVGNEGDTTKHHTVGYGLDGTFYNQTANQTWKVDTTELTTPYYVKDAIHDSLTNLSFNDLSDVNITGADQGDIPMLNETNQWVNYTPIWLASEVDGNIGNEGDTTAHLTNGFGISTLDYNQTVDKVIEIDTTMLNNLYASNADSSLFEEYFAVIKPKKESLNLFVGEDDNAYQTIDVATFIVNQETSEDFYGAYFSGSVVIRQLLLGASSLRSSIHASTSLHSYEDEENVTNIIYPLSATLNEHGYNLKIEVCKFGDTIESSSYGTIKMEYCFNRNENNITVYDSICWFVSGNLNDSMFIASPRYNTTKDSLYIPIFSRTTKLPNEFSADLSIESSFNSDIVYMASLKSNDYNKKIPATWPGKKNEFTLEGTVVDTTNYTLDADKLDGQHGSYYLDNTDEQDIEYTSPLYGYNDHGSLTITGGTGTSIYTFGAGIDPTYGGLVPPNDNLGSDYFLNANGDWAAVSTSSAGDTTKHHVAGYGIDGTFYNQTANQTWSIDTSKLTTPHYVKDAISDSSSWIQSGTDVILKTITNNVGIGTIDPDYPLEIIAPTNTTYGSRFRLTSNLGSATPLMTYLTSTAISIDGGYNRAALYALAEDNPPSNSNRDLFGAYLIAKTPIGSTVDHGNIYGAYCYAQNYGSGTTTNLYGGRFQTYIDTGTVLTATGFYTQAWMTGGSNTNWIGFKIYDGTLTNEATITNQYGIYMEEIDEGSSANYSLYIKGGKGYLNDDFGIKTTSPAASLEINHATGNNLRLTYNDNNGSASNYTDFELSSGGDLKITPSGTEVVINGAFNYGVDAGSSDTYVITLSPAPTAYVAGMYICFKANTINTGTATVNVNGLGAKTIIKRVSTTLANGDIAAGQLCMIVYDGTELCLNESAC